MLIKLSPHQLKECNEFADNCINTVIYRLRGQRNVAKTRNDIFVGKVGEMAVFNYLSRHLNNLSYPDLKIYKGRQKSHDADLQTADGEFKFAVKTQTMDSLSKYGNSYLLEKTAVDKFKDQFFVICVQLSEDTVLINGVFTFHEFTETVGAPKLSYLKSKAAFYVEDMHVKKIMRKP